MIQERVDYCHFCHKRKNFHQIAFFTIFSSSLISLYLNTWNTALFLQRKDFGCSHSNSYWNFLHFFSGSRNTCVVQSAKSNHGQSQHFSPRSKVKLRANCELLLGKKISVISWHIIVLSLIFASHCRIPNLMQNSVFYHSKPSQHWGTVMDTHKCKEKEYWSYILPNFRFKFAGPKSQQQYSWQECLCVQGKRAKKDTWAPKQRFSHFSVHQNHLEALLKAKIAAPYLQSFWFTRSGMEPEALHF